MRKEQILSWSALILVIVVGITLNNRYVNNKELHVGEIDSFMQYIFKTNLLNYDYIFTEDAFQIILYQGGKIEFLRVLTLDDNMLEFIEYVPGKGYDNKLNGLKNDRYFKEYEELTMPLVEGFVGQLIEELDLLTRIDNNDGIRIRLDEKIFEDFQYHYDEEGGVRVYTQGSEERKLRLVESDTVISKGAIRFIINKKEYDAEGRLNEYRIIEIYKNF